MGFTGDLSSINLAEVFQTISNAGKAGTLVVEDGSSRKCIFFDANGVRLLSSGVRRGVRLGERLVQANYLDRNRLEEFLSMQEQTSKPLGEILIESGVVDAQTIENMVRSQIEDEIYDLFVWKSAKFEFVDGPPAAELLDSDSDAIKHLAFDVNSLLLEAVRRVDEWEIIKESLPTFDVVLSRSSNAGDSAPESEDPYIGMIYPLVDGSRSINDLVQESHAGPFDVSRVIHELMQSGWIVAVTPEQLLEKAAAAEAAGDWNMNVDLLRKASRLQPHDTSIRKQLARKLLGAGEELAALDEFRTIAEISIRDGNKNEALEALQEVVQRRTDDIDAWMQVLVLQVELGRKENAMNNIALLCESMIDNRQYDDAQRFLERFEPNSEGDLRIPFLIGKVYARKGSRLQATEAFQKLIHSFPADKTVQYEMSRKILDVMPDMLEARDIYDRLMQERNQESSETKGKGKLVGAAIVVLIVLAVLGFFGLKHTNASDAWAEMSPEIDELMSTEEYLEADRILSEFIRSHSLAFIVVGEAKGKLSAVRSAVTNQRAEAEALARERGQEVEALEISARQALDEDNLIEAVRLFEAAAKLAASYDMGQRESSLTSRAEKWQKYLDDSQVALDRARAIEASGDWEKAINEIAKVRKGFPKSELARNSTFPLHIQVFPPTADIHVNNKLAGQGAVTLRVDENTGDLKILVDRDGYRPEQLSVDNVLVGLIEIRLVKNVVWRYQTESSVRSEPVPLDDVVLAAASDGRIYCLGGERGSLLWKQEINTSKPIETNILVRGQQFFFGSTDGNLYSMLHGKDGAIMRWTYVAGAPLKGRIAFSDSGVHLFAVAGGDLHGVIRESGTAAWRKIPLGGDCPGGVTVNGNHVLVGTTNGWIYCVEAAGGGILWKQRLEAGLYGRPVVVANRVIATLQDGTVLGLDPKTGDLAWRARAADAIRVSPAETNDAIYVGTEKGVVQRIEADGTVGWRVDGSAGVSTGLVTGGRYVLVGYADGFVRAYDQKDGTLIWEYQTGEPIYSFLGIDDERVYLGSDDRNIYVFGLE